MNKQRRIASNHYNQETEQCTVEPVRFEQPRGNAEAIDALNQRMEACNQQGDTFVPQSGQCIPAEQASRWMTDPKTVEQLESERRSGGIPDYNTGQTIDPARTFPVSGIGPQDCNRKGGTAKTEPGGRYDLTNGGTCHLPQQPNQFRIDPRQRRQRGPTIGPNRTPPGEERIYEHCAPSTVIQRVRAENPRLDFKSRGPGKGGAVARDILNHKIMWEVKNCK